MSAVTASRLFASTTESNLLELQLQRQQNDVRVAFNKIHSSAASGRIPRSNVEEFIQNEFGLNPNRSDIKESLDAMDSNSGFITFDDFYLGMTATEEDVLQRAFSGNLAVPDFKQTCEQMVELFEQSRALRTGVNADYIPQLALQDPEWYGISVCTVDGQRFSYGDTDIEFTIQSCSKVFTYALALEEHGIEKVHSHIGVEPSGRSFNEFVLDRNDKPHNPMINAGAIVSCSLLRPDTEPSKRFAYLLQRLSDFAGGAKISFDQATYLSEKETADRNYALGYYMHENNVFPDWADLVDSLEFYFQTCSTLVTARKLAVMAGTLANGGVCPTTSKRIVSPDTVKCALQMMYHCGMYDYSGEWSCTVGLPAKSGVAGAVAIVIPGIMGICIWSPPLDPQGNSARGVDFCRRLTAKFGFSIFDQLVMEAVKRTDPSIDYMSECSKYNESKCDPNSNVESSDSAVDDELESDLVDASIPNPIRPSPASSEPVGRVAMDEDLMPAPRVVDSRRYSYGNDSQHSLNSNSSFDKGKRTRMMEDDDALHSESPNGSIDPVKLRRRH